MACEGAVTPFHVHTALPSTKATIVSLVHEKPYLQYAHRWHQVQKLRNAHHQASASSAPQDTGTHARGPLVLLFGTFFEGKLRFGLLDSEGYATEAADAWGIADEGCQGCTYWCISSDESKGSVMVWLFSLALYQ
jgi:hypothetical protein